MKASRTCLLLAALLLATSFLHADILVLKNGQRLEGKVLSETPEAVYYEYNITEKIKDQKNFPRTDIEQLIRQRPEELEIVEVRKKLPTPDMMTADEYERLIQDHLRPFANKYKGTPEAAEVEKMITEVTAEKEKVVSGQLKVDGKWLDADAVKRDAYNIDAKKLRNEFSELAESNKMEDWVAALRIYTRMGDVQNGFPASLEYPKMLEDVQPLLKKFGDQVNKMIQEQPILAKAREDNLSKLIEPDLSRTTAAIKAEDDRWRNNYEAEKRARITWLIPYKMDLRSLQDAQKQIVNEITKINTTDMPRLIAVNEQLTAALRYIADENVAEAEGALDGATKAAGGNTKDYSRVITVVRASIQSLKSDLNKRKSAQRTGQTGATALGGATDAPIKDDRVAAALAAAQNKGKGDMKGEEAPAADAKGDAKADAKAESKAAPKAAPKPATPKPAPVALPVEEEEGISPLIVGAVALLAILLIAVFFQKKKKAAAQED
ncbi:MAG: hypothetical protein H7A55_20065 [Verrucomicrobiaceae bacterium]|nr:hypothetical protein [Verrucomicrobiaceae bacterium]